MSADGAAVSGVSAAQGGAPASVLWVPSRVTLLDGSAMIHRAFHAVPPTAAPDGRPVNAVLGFCQILFGLLRRSRADCIAIVYDADRRCWRHDVYGAYKANRPPLARELVAQLPLIREAAACFAVASSEADGFEADDVIATWARRAEAAGARASIVSSDKDLMQLVNGAVNLYDPRRKEAIGPEQVEARLGVAPPCVADYLALCGDAADNVPGVSGVGAKTAAALIGRFGSVDALYRRIREVKQAGLRLNLIRCEDDARLSLRLTRLRYDAPIAVGFEALIRREPDWSAVAGFLERWGLSEASGALGRIARERQFEQAAA